MPYENEFANKVSHIDIVKNPEIAEFLSNCDYLTMPSDNEISRLVGRFQAAPNIQGATLPHRVISIDGSFYEASIDEKLPSSKVGYIKIGSLLIEMEQYKSLTVLDGRFVDPFRVAELQENNSSITFPLPSSNVIQKGKKSVRDSFRATMDSHLRKYTIVSTDPRTSLRNTLFLLGSLREGQLGTGDPRTIIVHKCPECERQNIELHDIEEQQYCPGCGAEVYPSDCLRIWEEVSDYQSNVVAMSRFMQQLEHMITVHYIRYLAQVSLQSLGALAFFIDGPLAIFGNGAWLHSSIMKFLYQTNEKLRQIRQPELVIIGLQKTGQVSEHVRMIDRYVPNDVILPISDEYRYTHIIPGREPSGNGFGYETYYGQDFIYKTSSSRTFVFALPYPEQVKNSPDRETFCRNKVDLTRYSTLPRALRLLQEFETDLFKNAVIPIALAHRYTAISLVPGGRVLDLFTRRGLGTDNR